MTEPVTFRYRIHGDKQAKKRLKKLLQASIDLTPLLRKWGARMLISIGKNFEGGGRPDKWVHLKFSKKPSKLTGKPVILKKAINYIVKGDEVLLSPMAGLSSKYQKIHQFGSVGLKRGGYIRPKRKPWLVFRSPDTGELIRTKKVKIPARPYLMAQDEDVRGMEDDSIRYFEGSIK